MKIFRLLFGLFLLFSFSCVKDLEPDAQTPDNGEPTTSHVVPVQRALDELNQMLGATRGETRSTSALRADQVQVVARPSQATRSGGGADTLFYIVNFDDQAGYAIMGADDRIEGVIALVDDGSLSPEEFLDEPQTRMSNQIDNNRRLLFRRIVDYANENVDANDGALSRPPICYGPWEIYTRMEKMLRTKWHQYAPFNNFCPVVDDRRCPAGCVAIALGQIIAYNKMTYGIGPDEIYDPLDWNGIFSCMNKNNFSDFTDSENFAVAQFSRLIGDLAGMEYAPDGSTSNIDKAMNLLRRIGYTGWGRRVYDVGEIKEMLLDHGLPVYMRGFIDRAINPGGHAWVVDGIYGYSRFVKEGTASTIEYRDLIHCNFGWEGDSDGFYHSGIFWDGVAIPDIPGDQSSFDDILDTQLLVYTIR